MSLTPPPPFDSVKNAIENCELMIEESVEVVRAINSDKPYPKPSYRGEDYDLGYAQGRKDACRVILLSFNEEYSGPISEDVL